MTHRLSQTLRQQFEIAKRAAELNGTLTSAYEVRAKVAVANSAVAEQLAPIEHAAERNDAAWLLGNYPDWKSEHSYLNEELRLLAELRDQIELFIRTFRAT